VWQHAINAPALLSSGRLPTSSFNRCRCPRTQNIQRLEEQWGGSGLAEDWGKEQQQRTTTGASFFPCQPACCAALAPR
jgi:hypothetical protein